MTVDAQSRPVAKIGLVWGGDPHAKESRTRALEWADRLIKALARRGVAAEIIIYSDQVREEVRERLLRLDGALVWVNPIMDDGHDRTRLDALLREVSAKGIWVSTHPDVILKMGTKEVLMRTQHLPWGTDTHLYRTPEEMREQLPARLNEGPRVLKQNRGNGGNGVWKVELAISGHGVVDSNPSVLVLHALQGSAVEEMSLDVFTERCAGYFANSGLIVDQPFQARLPDGMVRCYLVQDKVAGFGHQYVRALMPPPPLETGSEAVEVPPRLYYGPDKPEFQALKVLLESEWVSAMQRALGIDRDSLPVLWDADFLYGPKTASGEDTYVLCEINVSSVSPFPQEAAEPLADAVVLSIFPMSHAQGR